MPAITDISPNSSALGQFHRPNQEKQILVKKSFYQPLEKGRLVQLSPNLKLNDVQYDEHQITGIYPGKIYCYTTDKQVIEFVNDANLEKYLSPLFERLHSFFPNSKPELELDTDFETGISQIMITINSSLEEDQEFETLSLMYKDWALMRDKYYTTHFNIA